MFVLLKNNEVVEVDRGRLNQLFKDLEVKAVIITDPSDIYARNSASLLRWAGTTDFEDTHENIVQSLQDCQLGSLY